MTYQTKDTFERRHIGPDKSQIDEMLSVTGVDSLDQLIYETVPDSIRIPEKLDLPEPLTEYQLIRMLRQKAAKNEMFKSYIGMGFYHTFTPPVIQRNILENPGWYTQYTPYQAEISQGRLEALLNFQTMVTEISGMEIANASLLDESTAAAEAMTMLYEVSNKGKRENKLTKFFVHENCFPQTKAVLELRAEPLGIEIVYGNPLTERASEAFFGVFLQNPDLDGNVHHFEQCVREWKSAGALVVMAVDLLSLALITPPGKWGVDVVVGNTQRFGIPMGFGGPHAAFFATLEKYVRNVPGRIIGVSLDVHGNNAYRMTLQTREQHIKRDKATSNICTAQALLAIMAGMYGAYHGANGLKRIATDIHLKTSHLNAILSKAGYKQINDVFFDTITLDLSKTPELIDTIEKLALENNINFRYDREKQLIGISLDETTLDEDLEEIARIFYRVKNTELTTADLPEAKMLIPSSLKRTEPVLKHPVFNSYRTETKMMRYLKSLENKDLSLTSSMIPLGSCTMKLNAAAQLQPISWAPFSAVHPFVPANQVEGYLEIIKELESYLNEITGLYATSLQPNSGAQGEYAGLMVIRAYLKDKGEHQRNVCLIPSSAHGTNPASAVMAGMKVIVVKCDERGNIDLNDLKVKAEKYQDTLAALMITYPSTHGVFESSVKEICKTIHDFGGQVYLDGANMNAQVGLTSPAMIGADVCHLNLHKTFSIPHGGGGPGMGPICVAEHLAQYLPTHPVFKTGGEKGIPALASAPFGSASILLISYAYIRLLGEAGMTKSTIMAILNANYIKSRLAKHYEVLYTGERGRAAHEMIIDLRPFRNTAGIEVEDVAKRLIDYGFHAPTISFPVPGTMMIEPTESEDKEELDRFCDAMIHIREEIQEIADGIADSQNNLLKNAPHTAVHTMADEWNHPYSRAKAVYPVEWLKAKKFWVPVGRISNTYGDRNLFCVCPPMEDFEMAE